jgi:predicted Zn-dependent protease
MWNWIMGAAAAVLWVVALRKAWDVAMRTGRQIERSKIGQAVGEMYASEAELVDRIEREPREPAPLLKYAGMAAAAEKWPEMEERARLAIKRFPRVIQGYVLLGHALWQSGDKEQSRIVVRKALKRFPEDHELRMLAIQQAMDIGNWQMAARISRKVRRDVDHPVGYVSEVMALIQLKQYAKAEKILNEADTEMPDNAEIAEAWGKLEAAIEAG